ncbi:hypothetical protein D3C84_808450 [compost metagenome]
MVDVSGLPVSLIGRLYRMGPVAEQGRSMNPPASEASVPVQASDEASMTAQWSAGR